MLLFVFSDQHSPGDPTDNMEIEQIIYTTIILHTKRIVVARAYGKNPRIQFGVKTLTV